MATYLIGDIHGCYQELCALLAQVNFNATIDTLWLTGDLVARGPESIQVLRYIRSLGKNARIVLGNHDLNLLAEYYGRNINQFNNFYLKVLLESSDGDEIMNWLRHQPLLQFDKEKKLIMTHAGILPQWDLNTAQQRAREVELILTSKSYLSFLHHMYGNMPNYWSEKLTGMARLRFITNVLTRMRYCFSNGQLDMICKKPPYLAPAYLKPWFKIRSSILVVDSDYTIIFGHWASLNGKGTPQGIIGLDTGCCWGGSLTMLCWENKSLVIQPSMNN
ncbi:MAG: bis(5'-nucleosyl)-tetraphosphatase (symmetrical) ApaH [Candidatus Dasytiphilus stammeri]